MEFSSLADFSEEDKLEILQRLDQFRVWHSLDEKRYCLVCGKIITGQEIQVSGGINDNEPLRVNCPTEHCNSLPIDWVRPTDEVLIKISKLVVESADVAAPQGHRPARKNSVVSRLRKFAVHSKRSA
jgi:hypothetical protein